MPIKTPLTPDQKKVLTHFLKDSEAKFDELASLAPEAMRAVLSVCYNIPLSTKDGDYLPHMTDPQQMEWYDELKATVEELSKLRADTIQAEGELERYLTHVTLYILNREWNLDPWDLDKVLERKVVGTTFSLSDIFKICYYYKLEPNRIFYYGNQNWRNVRKEQYHLTSLRKERVQKLGRLKNRLVELLRASYLKSLASLKL